GEGVTGLGEHDLAGAFGLVGSFVEGGVEAEQGGEVVGLVGDRVAQRLPEAADAGGHLPAEHAGGVAVDRGVGGRLEGEHLGVIGRVERIQVEGLADGGGGCVHQRGQCPDRLGPAGGGGGGHGDSVGASSHAWGSGLRG